MRKISLIIGILALVFLVSCEPPQDQDVIRFTAGDRSIELRLGFTETESIPMVELLTAEPLVFAANQATDYDPPEQYCMLEWVTPTTGSFSGTLYYYDDVAGSDLDGAITINVTSWEDVGGYCSGTFSGTATDSIAGPVTISDGYFNCKRFPDDTFGF